MINTIFLVLITNSAADAVIVYVCLSDVSFLSVSIHQEKEFECILGAAQVEISKTYLEKYRSVF